VHVGSFPLSGGSGRRSKTATVRPAINCTRLKGRWICSQQSCGEGESQAELGISHRWMDYKVEASRVSAS